MAAILQKIFSFFLNENFDTAIQILAKLVHGFDNTSALAQIMAWHCPGDKPSSCDYLNQ